MPRPARPGVKPSLNCHSLFPPSNSKKLVTMSISSHSLQRTNCQRNQRSRCNRRHCLATLNSLRHNLNPVLKSGVCRSFKRGGRRSVFRGGDGYLNTISNLPSLCLITAFSRYRCSGSQPSLPKISPVSRNHQHQSNRTPPNKQSKTPPSPKDAQPPTIQGT